MPNPDWPTQDDLNQLFVLTTALLCKLRDDDATMPAQATARVIGLPHPSLMPAALDFTRRSLIAAAQDDDDLPELAAEDFARIIPAN